MKDPSFCSQITKSCCFPAFWLIILILAIVFGIFFVIVARDHSGNVVDWRLINNATNLASNELAINKTKNGTNTVGINESATNVKQVSDRKKEEILTSLNNRADSITPVLN